MRAMVAVGGNHVGTRSLQPRAGSSHLEEWQEFSQLTKPTIKKVL